MSGIIKYIQSTRAELRYVAWPTQSQTITYTILVVAISIAVAMYLGFFDFFFTRGLEEFIVNRSPIEISQPATVGDDTFDFNATPGAQEALEDLISELPAPTPDPTPPPAGHPGRM